MAVDSNRQRTDTALGARHLWMITSMVVVLIVASALIPIDQVVTAQGIVVSQSPTILVQPLETSIVRSIDVREGQRVRAGDVLARLDPTFAAADLATLAAQVTSLEAEVARLQAEAAGKPFSYTGTDPSWLLQAAIHAHRMAEFDSKIENFRHKADELASVISRAESDADGLSRASESRANHGGYAQAARGAAGRQQAATVAGHG